MKAYATAIGIKNRTGQKMIQVYEHCQKENEIGLLVAGPKKVIGNYEGYYQMKPVMNDGRPRYHKTSWASR